MSKTIALRIELQRLLKNIACNVYYEQAPDSAAYPYVVYELSELTYSYGKTTLQLEINVLGYGANSTDIETLADNIQKVLDKYHFINNEIQFSAYKGLRQIIKEDDKKIIRRRLLFEIQLHELKGE